MSSLSRRSLAMWMSSSPGRISNLASFHSAATRSSPSRSSVASAALMIPVWDRAVAYALDPSMSCRHIRLSNEIDALNWSISGSCLPTKRPPQS